MTLNLCHKCKEDFIESGKRVQRTNTQIKETCDYCNYRKGFEYEITDGKSGGAIKC